MIFSAAGAASSYHPPIQTGSLTLTELSRDRMNFDMGTSSGEMEALVPFAGTASPGLEIEGRAVSLDDYGVLTTEWQSLGLADGSGVYSGTISVRTPTTSQFRREVRIKTDPTKTATGTYVFHVGHVGVILGQSELARIVESFFSQNTVKETMVTNHQAVKQLAAPYRVGRVQPTAQQPFTVGVDTLPTGITLSGNKLSVNKSTYDGVPFRHWYCPDVYMDIGDERFVMTDTKFETVDPNSVSYFIKPVLGGGYRRIQNCEFIAEGSSSSFTAYLRSEISGSGANIVGPKHGLMVRNLFRGSPNDWGKPVNGIYVENVIEWTYNIPGVLIPWTSSTVFNTDDWTIYNNKAWKSKVDGNIGNVPPVDSNNNPISDAFWSQRNPHSDGLNPQYGVDGTIYFARNLIRSGQPEHNPNGWGLVGQNNLLYRGVPDPAYQGNKIGLVILEENVVIRRVTDAAFLTQLHVNSLTTPPVFRGNMLTETNTWSGGIVYGGAVQTGTEWTSNVDQNGQPLTVPTNAVVKTFTSSVEKAVEISSHVDTTIVPLQNVNSANNAPTAAMRAIGNIIASELPGRRSTVGFATESGTTLSWLCQDSATDRQMDHYIAFINYLCGAGGQPGALAMNWQAGDQALGSNFAENIFPMITGMLLDGTPISMPYSLPNRSINRTLAEVHAPWTRTRMILFGDGARQPEADMTNSAKKIDGSHQFSMENYQDIRAEYETMVVTPTGDGILVPFLGVQPMNVFCGQGDGVHPADHVDGLPMMARYAGINLMQAWGIFGDLLPRYDSAYYEPTGAYAEFWSSAGPITTGRIKRGLTAIPATYPHRTEVFSWEIGTSFASAVFAQSAVISSGRTRVSPISGSFANGQTFRFGGGGGTGIAKHGADNTDRYDLNYPVVDLGFLNVDGIAVAAMPSSLLLTASGIT